VAVVGLSETGKTRLLIALIEEFTRRGVRTFALKHCAHGFTLDREDKDTWDFSRAGAEGVALVSPGEWAVLRKAPAAGLAAVAAGSFPDAQVVLVEGGKDEPGLEKIEVLRAGISTAVRTPARELLAVVADFPVEEKRVPVFPPDAAAAICDLILSRKETPMAEVKLEVDGNAIPLNAFVREFIEKTIVGMVSSLQGVAVEPGRITLTIRRDKPEAGKSA
jgi:molybdopterin-guanine dinucleotide biosynthesis protein B